jgi:hypothetical protein
MPMILTPASRPAAATNAAVAPIAIVFTVCQETPSAAAVAETVVRLIINHRNTYRVTDASWLIAVQPACRGPD